jgi:tripartite ATP-independent transporter DctM subunit
MHDTVTATWILLGSLGIFLVARTPIAFALGFSSLLTAWYLDLSFLTLTQKMVSGIQSSSLLAIPFFLLSGEIMAQGGISRKLVDVAKVLVGRWRGGLAQVNCLGSMFFAGISGSPVADVASLGPIAIPMMVKSGYDKDFAVALTVSASCQATLIPPSHNMIIYALAAGGGVSIGKLLLAGAVPGVLVGAGAMVVSYVLARMRDLPRGEAVSFRVAVKVIYDGFLGLLTAFIITAGVIAGIFTATESSAVACVYAFIVTFFVYREIGLKQMRSILFNTMITLSMVMALMATAQMFGYLLALLRIPDAITGALLAFSDNKIAVLLLINIVLLGLGCIMDMAPLIIICTPALLPAVKELGMDPIQFGVMLILNLSIGLCTPPVGSALFVGCAVGKLSMAQVTRAMLPFFAVLIVVLVLVTFVPSVSLMLPKLMMG